MSVIKLADPNDYLGASENKIYRDGYLLEKGVAITDTWLESNREDLSRLWGFFTAYPDLYLDLIKPVGSNFKLFFYQRLFLRACMRFNKIYITAARATSKTFQSIQAKYLQCVFIPHHNGAIVAPNKTQAAKISKQKLEEIWRIWPLLKNELEVFMGEPHANMGKDYVELYFANGSTLTIVGAN